MYSGGWVSARPLRWHSLHLIWSCFSWGHVVHCTFVLCVHIEYKIVKQEACLVGKYLLKCRFCFQRAYVVPLLHSPAILEKGAWDRLHVSGFGTKAFPSIFMQHNLFYFWKFAVLREWIDFCHCFQSWETVTPCIFLFPKENDTLFKQKFVNLQCPLWKCHYYVWWRVFQCFLRVCFTLSFSASLYTGTSGSSFFMLSTVCLVEEVEVKGCVHSPCPALALDRLWVPVVELFQWSCLFPRSRPLLSPRVGFFHFSFLQPQCIWTCVLTTTDFIYCLSSSNIKFSFHNGKGFRGGLCVVSGEKATPHTQACITVKSFSCFSHATNFNSDHLWRSCQQVCSFQRFYNHQLGHIES